MSADLYRKVPEGAEPREWYVQRHEERKTLIATLAGQIAAGIFSRETQRGDAETFLNNLLTAAVGVAEGIVAEIDRRAL